MLINETVPDVISVNTFTDAKKVEYKHVQHIYLIRTMHIFLRGVSVLLVFLSTIARAHPLNVECKIIVHTQCAKYELNHRAFPNEK